MFLIENCQLIEEKVQLAIKLNQFKGILRNKIIITAHEPYELIDGQFEDSSYNRYEEFSKKFHQNRIYCMKMLRNVAEAIQKKHPEWIVTPKNNVSDYTPGYNEGWIVRIVH